MGSVRESIKNVGESLEEGDYEVHLPTRRDAMVADETSPEEENTKWFCFNDVSNLLHSMASRGKHYSLSSYSCQHFCQDLLGVLPLRPVSGRFSLSRAASREFWCSQADF